jgi:hypothetical protein
MPRSQFLTGLITVMNLPASFKAAMVSWKHALGKPSLSSKEIDIMTSVIAKTSKIVMKSFRSHCSQSAYERRRIIKVALKSPKSARA